MNRRDDGFNFPSAPKRGLEMATFVAFVLTAIALLLLASLKVVA
jgi:hypothetical protein